MSGANMRLMCTLNLYRTMKFIASFKSFFNWCSLDKTSVRYIICICANRSQYWQSTRPQNQRKSTSFHRCAYNLIVVGSAEFVLTRMVDKNFSNI